MMHQAQVPDDIRELISLFCNEKNCNTHKCQCKKEGIFCSLNCKCKMNCVNINRDENTEETSTEVEDDTFIDNFF